MRRALFTLSDCRWVPWAIAASFLAVVSVNGALAYFAVRSDPGLVSEHPFELGNGYNHVLAVGAAQDALGWRGTVRFAADAGLRGRIIADLRDSAGAPIDGLAVKAALVRPVEPLPAQDLAFKASGPGRYTAPVTLTHAGQWDVRVTVSRGADVYEFVRRVLVQ